MYLGIDLGTSGVKALLIDEQQQLVASAQAALEVSRLHPGWSEQEPAHWIDATSEAIAGLAASHPAQLGAVRGIGLSGQQHGATLLDEHDAVLRPCILWNDTRSHVEASAMDADPVFRDVAGNICFPGFTAPKLAWVRQHEPQLFERVRKVLLPKDYLRLWLVGDHVSEMSDASGTGWLDVRGRCWSDALLTLGEMRAEQMPRLVEGSQASGQLREALVAQWGMRDAVVVAGGAGDNAASAVGMGAVSAGAAFVSIGTSGVMFAVTERHQPDPQSALHAFCHALPAAWHQMGVILSATDSLNWLAGITGTAAAELTAELGDDLRAPGSTTFLPYLSGERTPHNDALARGAFSGIGHECDRKAMTQAVLEGISFAFRDSFEALRETGTQVDRLTAVGGGSRSQLWLRMISTVIGVPVDVPAEGDFGAAFGAARLGLLAAEEVAPHSIRSICTPPAIQRTIEPDRDRKGAFDGAYARYRALYPAIKGAIS